MTPADEALLNLLKQSQLSEKKTHTEIGYPGAQTLAGLG